MEKEIFDVNLKAGIELHRDWETEKTFQPEGWSREVQRKQQWRHHLQLIILDLSDLSDEMI